MESADKLKQRPYPFRFALGTPTGQAVWREIMERRAAAIRSAISEGKEVAELEGDLKAVWDGRHLQGYLEGILVGYLSARALRKTDRYSNVIAKIVWRHPSWTAKQICKRLDRLGKVIPRAFLGKNAKDAKSRSWEDALSDRNSRLARRIEKHISRIRIATRRISEARGWKGYINTGILP